MRPHSIRGLLGIAAVLVAALVVALAFGVSTQSPTAQAQAVDDDPRLINITTLEQLNAFRWDLNGAGTPFRNVSDYEAAFPNAEDRTCADGCTGYELMRNLDFDQDSSYADAAANKDIWTTGGGWTPIDDDSNRFAATFDGNDYTISNLFIKMETTGNAIAGLFERLRAGAVVRNLGLVDIDITVTTGAFSGESVAVGGLAGENDGTVESIHVTGGISVTNGGGHSTIVGGLLGQGNGTTTASSAMVAGNVQGRSGIGTFVGGRVGVNSSGTREAHLSSPVKGTAMPRDTSQ